MDKAVDPANIGMAIYGLGAYQDLAVFWFPLITAVVLAIGVLMYVILDGFDLGVGILFPFGDKGEERDIMMASIGPFWDGNETWIIMGGAALYAAFPLAYAILMPALYLPLFFMIAALIFRGISFEFRAKAPENMKWLWDGAFWLGSTLMAFWQGVMLGTFIQGFPANYATTATAGSATWLWFNPFSLFCGLALIVGYALLGSTWLILKTEDVLQHKARILAGLALVGTLVFIGAVSLWTPMTNPEIAERWFSLPNFYYLSQIPILTLLIAGFTAWAIFTHKELLPYLGAVLLFALSYIGLGISMWPYLVPREITLWDAATAPESQFPVIIGIALLLPVTLGYIGYTYYIFRGKAKVTDSYTHM